MTSTLFQRGRRSDGRWGARIYLSKNWEQQIQVTLELNRITIYATADGEVWIRCTSWDHTSYDKVPIIGKSWEENTLTPNGSMLETLKHLLLTNMNPPILCRICVRLTFWWWGGIVVFEYHSYFEQSFLPRSLYSRRRGYNYYYEQYYSEWASAYFRKQSVCTHYTKTYPLFPGNSCKRENDNSLECIMRVL